ncbi:MAG: hypothetical protein Q9199_001591 [Rusavskia elegans]
MDPLSIAASAITVAALAESTCRAFVELRELCKTLPGRLHVLSNEVTDINVVLIQVAKVFEERASSTGPFNPLIAACDRAKLNLTVLQAYAWRKEQPQLRALQEDINTIKCNLNVALGASNPRDMLRIRLDLESLSAVVPQPSKEATDQSHGMREEVMVNLAHHHDGLRTSINQVYDKVDQRIAKVEDMIKKQGDQLQSDQSTQIGPYLRPILAERRLVDRILGRLFVGYAGLPLLNDKCDVEECDKSQIPYVNMEYWFPLGLFWSQIVRLQLGYQSHLGPQLSLTMLRRVPDSAPCVNFALDGNIDGLKDLFKRGLASPKNWALYGKQYQTCKFLVNAGADPDYRPISKYDNSPKNKAFDFILQGGLSSQIIETLSCLTEGSDFIEEQNYTQTHRIVLGLSMMSLEEELIHHPDQIDAVDALGRSPSIWAAARVNDRNVALLLGAGADPVYDCCLKQVLIQILLYQKASKSAVA